ncbi:hypothetical protein LTR64_006296 [Lithohypha guttulata]|uniref:Cation efflux protein transmembrane domain-containing protein n=1 Tax=Lithohypha guttulata TaxID=1690604 RepID=A0AAN7YDZ5_9EURO|nr:hypothetical protein LTR51_001906 [Lithohypha guttulata]KAK5090362.1 hypothetical protein LTR05_000534 [Lithohypha guttulata]
MVGRRAFPRGQQDEDEQQDSLRKDLESSASPKLKPRPRFKDAVEDAMSRETTLQLKKQLTEGIDTKEYKKYRKTDDEIKNIKNKKVRAYYSSINQRLDDWLEVDTIVGAMADDIMDSMDPDADHDGIMDHAGGLQHGGENIEGMLPQDVQEKRRKDKKTARRAINVNVLANIILLIAKGFAALSSSSLSLIASLLDSALDLLCTAIVWTTNRLVSWRLDSLKKTFPVGRRRLEPVGILVFSVIMIISFAQILQESVQRLLPKGDHSIATLPAVAIAAMAGTVGLKGIIGLFCVKIKTTQVQALVQDCKTDVYFNTLSLLFPLIGKAAGVWWLDPAGAAILSLYIIYDWSATAMENVTNLCGAQAEMELLKKLTYMAFRFSPLVSGFKSITAYHAGDGIWVEYDVLLDEKTPLRRAHDISETLQYCAEALPDVDRCFVTCDYSSANPSGHGADSTTNS